MSDGWTIGLVEDRAEFREYLQELFSRDSRIKELITWESAELFWRDESQANLDLVFLDVNLPHMSGVELVRLINEKMPDLPTIMLTSVSSEDVIFEALKAGAKGYILKKEIPEISAMLEPLISGGAIMTPTIALRVSLYFQQPISEEASKLTPREKQVLGELMTGASTEEVADTLSIAIMTLRNHIKNIYKKLNVHNKIELARKAGDLGLGGI